MNWKEQPHLFKGFEVRTKYHQRCPIVGATLDGRRVLLQTSQLITSYEIEGVILIARPIEYMTKEEIEKLLYWDTYDGQTVNPDSAIIWRDRLEEQANHNDLNLHPFLHLLSIGVYPFDQSHFEDGTVLDSREVS